MTSFGGIWSDAKLKCVDDYASTYLKVFKNQDWATQLDYVDAFAGSGLQRLKRTSGGDRTIGSLFGDAEDQAGAREFIEGSPLRVIRTSQRADRRFDKFIFIEANRASCDRLEARVSAEFGASLSTEFQCGDANAFLKAYAKTYNRSTTRSLVFLDPFGCEVEWETVAALGSTQACDVWYLFPLGGAIRLMTTSGQIDPVWESALDRIFGGREWRERFYSRTVHPTLFGDDEEVTERHLSTRRVVSFIQERLATEFAGVSSPAVLCNSQNSPMFALVLAVANPSSPARKAALDIANYLTRKLNES